MVISDEIVAVNGWGRTAYTWDKDGFPNGLKFRENGPDFNHYSLISAKAWSKTFCYLNQPVRQWRKVKVLLPNSTTAIGWIPTD